MKTLILLSTRFPTERYLIKSIKEKDVDIRSIYTFKRHDIHYKIAKMYMAVLKLPYQSIWYGSWKRSLDEYDRIILHNSLIDKNIMDYIWEESPNARHIVWNWDKIGKDNYFRIDEKYRQKWEIWTFDTEDCKEYGYSKNVQFYFPEKWVRDCSIKYDLFICLKDKGRYNTVCSWIQIFNYAGLNSFIRVVPDYSSKNKHSAYYGKELSYDEVLLYTSKSRCLVEIVKEEQKGLSLRTMESIFYDKKLITNNIAIKEEEFYDHNNIYIMTESTRKEDIIGFMQRPYIPVPEYVKAKHTFQSWLSNFERPGNIQLAFEGVYE